MTSRSGPCRRSSSSTRRGALRSLITVTSVASQGGVAVMTGYFGLLTVAAWRAVATGRHRTAPAAPPKHRFVILVPAHDEERLIGSTVASLMALDYPPALRSVHVVADNCTDATATIARAHGAEVHERTAPDEPGKGPALRWLLARLWARDEPHDAVVIIDADTTASADFLRVMDAKLSAGASAVQAYYAVRDEGSSGAVGFRAAALAVRHYLRPLGRTELGGASGLYGNGMVFRADVLRARAFTNHLTEDIEYQLELLLEGTKVAFAPDARVEAEMPTTVAGSRTQHERWERGRIEMARRFVPRLLRRSITSGPAGRFAYVDAAMDQLLPPFSLIAAATVASGGLAVLRALFAPSRAARRGVATAAVLAVIQAAHVMSGLKMVDAPASVYRSLLSAPKMVWWKLGLWLRVLKPSQDVSWVRTQRNEESA